MRTTVFLLNKKSCITLPSCSKTSSKNFFPSFLGQFLRYPSSYHNSTIKAQLFKVYSGQTDLNQMPVLAEVWRDQGLNTVRYRAQHQLNGTATSANHLSSVKHAPGSPLKKIQGSQRWKRPSAHKSVHKEITGKIPHNLSKEIQAFSSTTQSFSSLETVH